MYLEIFICCVWRGGGHFPGIPLGLQGKQFYLFSHPPVPEKAFDKNPTFLYNRSSKKTGGGSMSLHNKSPIQQTYKANIILNTKKFKTFSLKFGVRQGDPFCLLLFNVLFEDF